MLGFVIQWIIKKEYCDMNAAAKHGLSILLFLVAGGFSTYASAQAGPVPFKNTGNSLCLADSLGSAITQSCAGTVGIQKWVLINTGTGYLIKNATTGACLDNNAGGTTFTSSCSGIASQRWMKINATATTARYKSVGTNLFLSSTLAGAVVTSSVSANPLQIWSN